MGLESHRGKSPRRTPPTLPSISRRPAAPTSNTGRDVLRIGIWVSSGLIGMLLGFGLLYLLLPHQFGRPMADAPIVVVLPETTPAEEERPISIEDEGVPEEYAAQPSVLVRAQADDVRSAVEDDKSLDAPDASTQEQPAAHSEPVVTSTSDAESRTALVERVLSAIVVLKIEGTRGQSAGSGFVVDAEGLIATNHHVIEGARRARVTFHDGTQSDILGVVEMSRGRDIALVRVDAVPASVQQALALRDELPRAGEKVMAFGSPHGFAFSVSEGIVSGVWSGSQVFEIFQERGHAREVADMDLEATWIQMTAPISSGNSGGPVIDDAGRVIGMSTWNYTKGQNLNFAISAVDIAQLIEQSRSRGGVLKAFPDSAHVADVRPKPQLPRAPQPNPGQDEAERPHRIEQVTLPSGAVITASMLNLTKHEWDQAFPRDAPKYSDRFNDGELAVVVCHQEGRLQGGAASFYESARPKAFVVYDNSKRERALRIWNDEGKLVLYAEFRADRKDGLLCFLIDGKPAIIQEHEKGVPRSEYLVEFDNDEIHLVEADAATADESRKSRLSEAREQLAALETELVENERSLKQMVRKAYDDEKREWLKEYRAMRAQDRRARLRAREAAQNAAAVDAIRHFSSMLQPYRW